MSRLFPSSRESSTCPWYVVGGKISNKNLEQRINIKFCVKIDKSASEALALLTVAYGEYAMKKSSVSERHRPFKEGWEDVQDNPRSGQPQMQRTDENVDRVWTLVHSDQRVGVRVIAAELNKNRETVWQIVKENLGMRKNFYNNGASNQHRIHISSDLLHNTEMFDRVVTGDEIEKCPEGTKICWPFWPTWKRYCEVFWITIFKTVSGSGTIISLSA